MARSLGLNLSLRVAFLSVIAVLALCVAVINTLLLALNETILQARNQSTQTARDFDIFLSDLFSYLEGISSAIPLSYRDEPLLMRLLIEHPEVFAVRVIRPDGEILLQRQRLGNTGLVRISQQDWLETVQKQEVWTQVGMSIYDVPFLYIAMPVQGQLTGELLATLYIEMDLSAMWSKIVALKIGEHGYAYLAQLDGTLLAYQDVARLRISDLVQTSTGKTPSEMIRQSQSLLGSVGQGLAGEMVLFSATPLIKLDWVAIVEKPIEEVLNGIYGLLAVLFVALALVLASVLAIGRFTRRKIVAPLVLMQQGVQQFRQGNLDAPLKLPTDEQDEIGVLGASFNEMAERLRELVTHLETRVAERTRDLQIAAEVSKRMASTLDLDQLLPQLVESTAQGFDLYHVFVFLYDENTYRLQLAAGSGEHGRALVNQQIWLDLARDKGVVVSCALARRPTLVNDVRTRPDFLHLNHLSQVRSEFAVPMVVGGTLVGVLDLQSDEYHHFDDDMLVVMTSLGEQFAVAVQNARLYAEQLKVTEELRNLDNLKSQFVANMSHELRTPLNSIINNTRFVESGLLGDISPSQKEALSRALDSARHLLSIIGDLLDMAKIEANMMTLFIEDGVTLLPEIEASIDAARVYMENKPIELVLEIPAQLPPIVADKRRIRQILLNLMSNAAKYTEQGQVCLSVQVQDEDILFIIKDTGHGIAHHDHERIFLPFQQSAAGIRSSGGTGLGLPITRRLVEAHGGRLWLESELGQGSCFYVSLPIRSATLLAQMQMP